MLAVSALWHTIYQTAFHLSSPPQHHKLCRKVDSVHGRKTRHIKVSMVLSVAPLFWIRKRIQLLTRFRAVKLTRTVGMFIAQFLQHNIHQNVCKWKYPKIKKSSFVSKKKKKLSLILTLKTVKTKVFKVLGLFLIWNPVSKSLMQISSVTLQDRN